MIRDGFPVARPGQTVGLLGGSFDPAHQGHVHITLEAIKRFDLSHIWWLVSPGNPLKSAGPAPLAQRVARAQDLMQHPRVTVTDIETRLGTRYTAQTVSALAACYPGTRFVWLMGGDNLAQFHLWQSWTSIMEHVPIGILARPGDRISARMSTAARVYRRYRIAGQAAQLLARTQAPAWCFVNVALSPVSSTTIRAMSDWGKSSKT